MNDATPATPDMIRAQVKKAIGATRGKQFVFHNLRNTALTESARQGIPLDVGMKVQMHKRYVDLQAADVANACGTCQIDRGIDKQERIAAINS